MSNMKTEVRHILGGLAAYVRNTLSGYEWIEKVSYDDTRDPLEQKVDVDIGEIAAATDRHSSYCEQGVLTELCEAATWLDRYRHNRQQQAQHLRWLRVLSKKLARDVVREERCTDCYNWVPAKDVNGDDNTGHYIWDNIWPKRCTAESFLAKAKALEAWAAAPIPDLPCGADDAYAERQEIATYHARLYRAAIYFLVK